MTSTTTPAAAHPTWCDTAVCRRDGTFGDGLTLTGHSLTLYDAGGWVVELHATDLRRGADLVEWGPTRISAVQDGGEVLNVDAATAAELAAALLRAAAATIT